MGEMAKKISNIDNEELLKVLNEAFAEEWLAYYQYWIGAQVTEGPMRTSIQGELMKHAKEELEHAEWLAVRIIQLGGTPILNPADWEKTASCKYLAPEDPFDVTLLREILDSERCAINRYQQICDMCWGKDFETFHISRKILHEELDHEQDWEDFLQDIKTGAQYAKNKQPSDKAE